MNLAEPGVGDFVLLNEVSEKAFMENLEKRFSKERIYTFIGNVVVSMNPYKKLNIYTNELIQQYRSGSMYELPPHVFAVADDAYRNMRDRNIDQCILITGESGAGKTEASKIIMRYIAAVSGSSKEVDHVKDQLLNSNPVLEAFGNAKTTRNDNSSRFGKYMDLQFDYKGDPVGGIVTNYLLEKSRVVYQSKNERNFHVFYQVLRSDDPAIREFGITNNPADYRYTSQSGAYDVPGIDDKADYKEGKAAMKVIGFKQEDIDGIYRLVAGILHLGNITFEAGEKDEAVITNSAVLAKAAKCFGCAPAVLEKALMSRTVKDSSKFGKDVSTPLSLDQAAYSRDALAKSTYDRLFSYIVKKINENIFFKDQSKRAVIGVLDIYGFEILQVNSFEQFCINYCNEKLQQVFIELTLKQEQEEYQREGIQWTPIEFFNNAIICKLIEDRSVGMIAKLDEECLRPGDPTAETLLAKFNGHFGSHAHYLSRETSRSDKTLGVKDFRLKHYAGDVQYTADAFIDKNKDLLFRDLMAAMNTSELLIAKSLFPEVASDDLKRPESAGTQFRSSMESLMKNLLSKNPHYVRCIKPNDSKSPGEFQDDLCRHQVRYLGLLENVRVKRAGFCYRQKFDKFLERYKMLSKATWPKYSGSPLDGCLQIVKAEKLLDAEYQVGRTKIFIRNPMTLFRLEEDRNEAKHRLATAIRARFLAYIHRKKYKKMRASAIKIEAVVRGHQAQKKYKKMKHSAILIAAIVRGFITRLKYRVLRRRLPRFAAPTIQRAVRQMQKRRFLKKAAAAAKAAGLVWRKVNWPASIPQLQLASKQLKEMYRRYMAKRYRQRLPAPRKAALEEKLTASTLFKGKKPTYEASVPVPYGGEHWPVSISPKWRTVVADGGEQIVTSFRGQKRNSTNLKLQPRGFVLTTAALYVLVDPSLKLKRRIPLSEVTGLEVSNLKDGVIVVRRDGLPDGDLIMVEPTGKLLVEIVTRIYRQVEKATKKPPKVQIGKTVTFNDGKANGKITFEQVADAPALLFKPVPQSKVDSTCAVPPNLEAAAGQS